MHTAILRVLVVVQLRRMLLGAHVAEAACVMHQLLVLLRRELPVHLHRVQLVEQVDVVGELESWDRVGVRAGHPYVPGSAISSALRAGLWGAGVVVSDESGQAAFILKSQLGRFLAQRALVTIVGIRHVESLHQGVEYGPIIFQRIAVSLLFEGRSGHCRHIHEILLLHTLTAIDLALPLVLDRVARLQALKLSDAVESKIEALLLQVISVHQGNSVKSLIVLARAFLQAASGFPIYELSILTLPALRLPLLHTHVKVDVHFLQHATLSASVLSLVKEVLILYAARGYVGVSATVPLPAPLFLLLRYLIIFDNLPDSLRVDVVLKQTIDRDPVPHLARPLHLVLLMLLSISAYGGPCWHFPLDLRLLELVAGMGDQGRVAAATNMTTV